MTWVTEPCRAAEQRLTPYLNLTKWSEINLVTEPHFTLEKYSFPAGAVQRGRCLTRA